MRTRRVGMDETAAGGALTSDGSALGRRHARVREIVMSFALRRARAPSVAELVHLVDGAASEADVRRTLSELAEAHALVLHPGGGAKRAGEIYVAHPFAFYPSLFQVSFTMHEGQERRSFDSPCIWCALGAAAALERGEVCAGSVITTCDGGDCSRPVSLEVRGDRIEPSTSAEGDDWLVHCLVPARDAWENVVYTCSNMLLFSSRRRVDEWRARNGVGPDEGDVKTLGQMAAMARGWCVLPQVCGRTSTPFGGL